MSSPPPSRRSSHYRLNLFTPRGLQTTSSLRQPCCCCGQKRENVRPRMPCFRILKNMVRPDQDVSFLQVEVLSGQALEHPVADPSREERSDRPERGVESPLQAEGKQAGRNGSERCSHVIVSAVSGSRRSSARTASTAGTVERRGSISPKRSRMRSAPFAMCPRSTCPSDKQENNRGSFVAAVALKFQNVVQYQGRIRPKNRAGLPELKGKVGPRTPRSILKGNARCSCPCSGPDIGCQLET
jgi:hypothetical protein